MQTSCPVSQENKYLTFPNQNLQSQFDINGIPECLLVPLSFDKINRNEELNKKLHDNDHHHKFRKNLTESKKNRANKQDPFEKCEVVKKIPPDMLFVGEDEFKNIQEQYLRNIEFTTNMTQINLLSQNSVFSSNMMFTANANEQFFNLIEKDTEVFSENKNKETLLLLQKAIKNEDNINEKKRDRIISTKSSLFTIEHLIRKE